ncbi:MAG: DEAD/DEAH box helicase [Acidobacteriota bacterium]
MQTMGWPKLAEGQNCLLVAPTGSGKTLAAFLWGLDRCSRLPEDVEPGVRVLYVSPLKALVYDIERNLRSPLVGIGHAATRLGEPYRTSRVDVRTGDTSQRDRQRQRRRPGEILVTTPESLYLLLGSQAAETLRSVHTVIVDEIHAFAPSKRGCHLAVSLERLSEICEEEPQRIGLSATVRPAETVAGFLGGDRPVEIVDASEPAHVELEIVVPVEDMDDPPPAASAATERPGGPILALSPEEMQREEGWRGPEVSGIWPSIYPRLLDALLSHQSTIVFANSRSLCERLANRLNELAREHLEVDEEAPDLVRAHHGSVSHAKRSEIEEALKAGTLRGIVATSSLELGIDMGAVDLVVLVESPGSVASGLQRVGRAGHGVGELSRGKLFPKFKGDLLECAVVSQRMLAGELEPIRIPKNPLDVAAQQIVAYCCDAARTSEEIETMLRRSYPFRELSGEVFVGLLEMLSGHYPSDDFADLKPRLSWDRGKDLLTSRRGAAMLTRFNAGTIPDRGLYGVHLGEDGPRVGELDEEMVYETRIGDTFFLGASTWRAVEITRDRVIVQPAPGEPGRMPFWRGDGPGRPIELGRALGGFVRELRSMPVDDREGWLRDETPLDDLAIGNLLGYLDEQAEATETVPSDREIVVERFRDEIGDWRLCILTPFGARVHAPWAMALEADFTRKTGFDVESMYTDDGIVLRFADVEELPEVDELFPDPEEVEELIVEQVGNSSLFASIFRESAARSLLLPRRRPGQRTPLWQQRLRSKNLLASVRKFPAFPIVLETYRECLQDHFDLPSLRQLLEEVQGRRIRVTSVETSSASPFARSLAFSYVAQYLYEQDAPLAERKAQALTLDKGLLRELLGHSELRELLDASALDQVEMELQCLAEDRQARDADDLHDVLRRLGDLSLHELEQRALEPPAEWLESLMGERRVCLVRVGSEERYIAAQDAGRYRDALGVQVPPGLPQTLLGPTERPLESLLLRYARSRGPFTTEDMAERFHLLPAQVEPLLRGFEAEGTLYRGEIRPGGQKIEWCDTGVLRRIKRRTLARLRGEVAAVEAHVLGRFLPEWQGVTGLSAGPQSVAAAETKLREVVSQLEGRSFPWSALCDDLLPLRVPGFQLDMLDMMAASGELVWIGRGSLGPRDGKIALCRRDRADLLLPASDEVEAERTPLQQAILDHLDQRGACFTSELLQRARRRLEAEGAPEVQSSEVEEAIWDLVWAGLVTNDTFLPLKALRAPKRSKRSAPRRSRRRGMVPPSSPRGARRAPAGAAIGGRWSLVSELVYEPPSDTERRFAEVSTLLERYGVVSRETALSEEIPGGFAALYPVLREMEESGRVRRGYFIEGLSGRQFALPGAVEQLRALRSQDETLPTGDAEERGGIEVLPAADPSNPWGSLLSWPQRSREDGPKARRVPGAWVVLQGGRPLVYLEPSARGVVTFQALSSAQASRGEDAEAALGALLEVARRRRRRSVRIERIDGEPANESPLRELFERSGFVSDYRGLSRAL